MAAAVAVVGGGLWGDAETPNTRTRVYKGVKVDTHSSGFPRKILPTVTPNTNKKGSLVF